MKLGAVILAAGAGTRLGGVAKALLATRDGRTFLSAITATAREVELVAGIVVVGPPFGDEVAAHARELGLHVACNAAPDRGMASSIAIGFAALASSSSPTSSCDAAWLWPVDHPDVRAETLRAIIAGLDAHAAARPRIGWRGGHPPLVARALWPALAACADLPNGARDVFAEADVVEVEVGDDGCVRDVDTATDLERDA